jgi:glycosyltransferase involved in cell wall biosynthesis
MDNMKIPEISVLLTTYNRCNLLERAINSVLNQSYRDFELIIVDDASTDNTKEIADRFVKKDDRVKFCSHVCNLGLPHARNSGLNRARGRYIAFMDDDDEWIDSDKLKKQLFVFQKHKGSKLGIVCSAIVIKKNIEQEETIIFKKPENIKERILLGNGLIHTSTVFTRKDLFNELGFFDVNLTRGIDSDFYRRAILNGYDVVFMEDVLVRYDETSSNRITEVDSVQKRIKVIQNIEYTLKKFESHFKQYPKARSLRYSQIAHQSLKIYFANKDDIYFDKTKYYLKESLEIMFTRKNYLLNIFLHIPLGVKLVKFLENSHYKRQIFKGQNEYYITSTTQQKNIIKKY